MGIHWATIAVLALIVIVAVMIARRHRCYREPGITEHFGGLGDDGTIQEIWWECPKCKKPISKGSADAKARAMALDKKNANV